jgi:hypothetical protein
MKIIGEVSEVQDRKTGKGKGTGRPWSCQRFKLDPGGDSELITCEAWGMRDLSPLDGKRISVIGQHTTEKWEGKVYKKFKLSEAPKFAAAVATPSSNNFGNQESAEEDDWRRFLMRAANLLTKCHAAAKAVGLEDPEDGRTLFIQLTRTAGKKFIMQLPARPMDKEAEAEAEEPEQGEIPWEQDQGEDEAKVESSKSDDLADDEIPY